MKIIAFFVPQYHRIPLNDEYWGEGFTEWVNIKNAKPLFEGHDQPKVPLNDNYYNLLDKETKIWQKNLAKKFGLYGFCYYHYWFNGKLLLEKPCEQILQDKEIDFPFCFCWANEAWTKQWVGERKVIIPQFYGQQKEWKEHFEYLLPFFSDERYIKENGKPVFVIYRPMSIPCLKEMIEYWNELAMEKGFPGIVYMNQDPEFMFYASKDNHDCFDYDIEYEPITSQKMMSKKFFEPIKELRRKILRFCEIRFGWNLQGLGVSKIRKITGDMRPDYDKAWMNILSRNPYSEKSIPCAFVNWDNSPRYKDNAIVYKGASPEKFEKYFGELMLKTKKEYKKDYLFVFAWNEWGEGGYLEPDQQYEYKYLEAIQNALNTIDGGL